MTIGPVEIVPVIETAQVLESPERRRARRHRLREHHGIVAARVRPGVPITVIDVSSGGALVETAHRLLPGVAVEVHLTTKSSATVVRARVLRCAIVRLGPQGVCYRGALGFDRPVAWLNDDSGYQLPSHETRPGISIRAATTPDTL